MLASDANANAHSCAIGLDVGGTKTAAGVVSFPSGRILAKQVIPTLPNRGGEAVLTNTLALAERLMTEADTMGLTVQGIGVGVAELVDPAGNVTSDYTIAWRGLPVQATFSELASTVVESDVRAPALAEAMFGAGRSYQIFAYVTVETGINYTLVQDGRPYAGARGNALILGNTFLTATCAECGVVSAPELESLASGPALVTRYNQAQTSAKQARRGEDVLSAVESGNSAAIEVIQTARQALGTSVGLLINLLDPEAVIVGGGLGLAGGLYWDSFVHSTRQHICLIPTTTCPFSRQRLAPMPVSLEQPPLFFKKGANTLSNHNRSRIPKQRRQCRRWPIIRHLRAMQFRRLRPIYDDHSHGTHVIRVYWHQFLEEHRSDIRGRVLELA